MNDHRPTGDPVPSFLRSLHFYELLGKQWLATIYVAGVSMLLSFFLGRFLGPEGYGRYSYALTVAALLAVFQDGGFKTLIFRETVTGYPVAAKSFDGLMSSALLYTLFSTCFLLVVLFLIPEKSRKILQVAVICFGFQTVAGFIGARLKGSGRFGRDALWQVGVRTLSAVMIAVWIIWVSPDATGVFTAWLVGGGLALLIFREGRNLPRPQYSNQLKFLIKNALAFVVVDAATIVYFRVDIVLLRWLTGNDVMIGQYAAAYRILEGVTLIAAPFSQLCFRQLRMLRQQSGAFLRLADHLIFVMGTAALLLVLGSILAGRWVITFCFGGAYLEAALLLPWIMGALFFILPNAILTQAAIALDLEYAYAGAAIGAALVNVGLNVWLIPRYEALGAAWATIITEAFLTMALIGGIRFYRFNKDGTHAPSR